jgi:hydroxyacylglutathione hydrolase
VIEVVRIPALSDNYIWMLHDGVSGNTAVVDPAEAAPVLAEAAARGWKIGQIWNTHWHPDHVGGNLDIQAATGAVVIGPAGEAAKIPGIARGVGEGDTVTLGAYSARILDVPAHTAGHIAYIVEGDGAPLAFVGDTMFAMGCGRLFEGTAADMFAAMRKLDALPDDTIVHCAHEYTASNGAYALVAEPENSAIVTRMAQVRAMRERGDATVPFTMAEERATNPFLRAATPEILGERRAAKDSFRG